LPDRLPKLVDFSLKIIVNIKPGNNPNPTLETLQKIANVLGVSLDKLIKE
jgi:transcriptional regulator with XRE-family HTH domain